MLPAENTFYRKGMTLGLTLAEIFSIVVFILLLAFAALLRHEEGERQAAEVREDEARTDLLIVREMISHSEAAASNGAGVSWADTDIWIQETRRLRDEASVARAEAAAASSVASAAQAAAAEATAAAAEARSLLEAEDVPAAAAERVQEQAAEIEALEQALAGSEQAQAESERRAAQAATGTSAAAAEARSLLEAEDVPAAAAERVQEQAAEIEALEQALAGSEQAQAESERRATQAATEAAAAATEARSLLGAEDVPAAVAERVQEQAAEIEALERALAESERAQAESERRAAQAAEQAEQAAAREEALENDLGKAERMAQQVVKDVADSTGLTPEQAQDVLARAARSDGLADTLAAARAVISSLDDELQNLIGSPDQDAATEQLLRTDLARARLRVDSLRAAMQMLMQQRDDAVDRAEYREAELRRYRDGLGIDPPPCWMDADRNPQHIFRIELTNNGFRVFDIAPAQRRRDDTQAMQYARRIETGREYVPAEFLALARPFFELGVSRTAAFGPLGCRFWIRPVDRTDNNKTIFQERERQLWRFLWFRW